MKNTKSKFKNSKMDSLLRKTFEREKMVSFKNAKAFLTFVGTLSWRVVLLSTMTSLKGARGRVKMIHNFSRYLLLKNKQKGPDYVIAYLKASQLAISKYLAKQPVSSLQEINQDYVFPRLAHGLPKIIGPLDRVGIRHNNRKTVILWMSIFGIFRVLMGTYKLKLSTIVAEFSGSKEFLEEKSSKFQKLTFEKIRALPKFNRSNWPGLYSLSPKSLLLLQTSSPSSKVSFTGALIDVKNLCEAGLSKPLLEYMDLVQSPLKPMFFMIRRIVLPEFEKPHLFTAARVAYVTVPELGPQEFLTITRLKARDRDNPNAPARDYDVLAHTVTMARGFNQLQKDLFPKSVSLGLCYPNFEPDEPYAILRRFTAEDTFIIPVESIASSHQVRFITNVSTKAEIRAATSTITGTDHLHKTEWAVGQVGQVQFAREPAGKLRVFAMVDVWTQSIMQPIHKLLTSILKSIPNDGTLNQTLSYKRARDKSIAYGKSFGYDLSAATDRLPIAIQVPILAGVFESIGIPPIPSMMLAKLWKQILVDRDFLVSKPPKGVEDPDGLTFTSIRYEVGQPMGALSSFNMLALTHHMIVQDIAQSLGKVKPKHGWYEAYELTGDDIVLFEEDVSTAYVQYMESLGLEINLKKSVVSVQKAAGEYLKKTWLKSIDVSMISWKQLWQNHSTVMGRTTDALYFAQKWDSAGLSVQGVVQRAALTWKDLSNFKEESLRVPYLALLSVCIKQLKVPVDQFLAYLLDYRGAGHTELSFRRLLTNFLNQKIHIRDINSVLEGFFKDNKYVEPQTNSFRLRLNAIRMNPMQGVRRAITEKILKLQAKLIFSGKLVMPAAVTSDIAYSEVQEVIQVNTGYVRSRESRIENHSLAEAMSGYDILSERAQRIVQTLVWDCMILPKWSKVIFSIAKIIPHYEETGLLVREDLANLSTEDLIFILDTLVGVESFWEAASLKDRDQRVAHKVTLRLLSTLRLPKAKETLPHEEFSLGAIFTMFPNWMDVVGNAKRDPFPNWDPNIVKPWSEKRMTSKSPFSDESPKKKK